ncbi:MAG: hypothetical protein O2960_20175 [Verrucomicrobia bacterium]|nr:hypothetical protein [Verrucomicrobiota bacterium]
MFKRILKEIRCAFVVLFGLLSGTATASMTVNDSSDRALIAGQGTQTSTPLWRVSEPCLNLWIEDVPLSYLPARGPHVSLGLAFKQRGPRPFDEDPILKPRIFSFGDPWASSWLSYIAYTDASLFAAVYFPGGGSSVFTADGASVEFLTNSKLSRTLGGGFVTSFERLHPNGAKEIYSQIFPGSSLKYAFRTALIDPAGNSIGFNYSTFYDGNGKLNLRLNSIVDADGRFTFLSYNSYSSFPNHVNRVTDPSSRYVDLNYDGYGRLSSIRDAGGFYSSFTYGANNWVNSMITFYGTTSFNLIGPADANADGRAAIVTLADNTRELFVYRDGLSGLLPGSYPAAEVPNTGYLTSFDNSAMYDRNSFHWDRKQYSALSQSFLNSLNINNLTADDYRKGRLSHWLKENENVVSPALSLFRDASPDGLVDGQKTWLDYDGQPSSSTRGTRIQPRFVAQAVPGNPARWSRSQRNPWGHVTEWLSSYTDPNTGGAASRSFTYSYINNDIDLREERDPQGQALRSYTYNGNHQVLTRGERVDSQTQYTTTYTYDPTTRQLTLVARPDGSSATYNYTTDRRLSQTIDQPSGTTHSFTYYSNGLPYTHTDPRGFVRFFYWDNLQRLTQIIFTGGSSLQHTYSGLNLASTRDRRGYTTYFGYDTLGQLAAVTDPSGRTTQYTYSLSGPVASIRNALAQFTNMAYDNNGRFIQITDPGGKRRSFEYDSLGQLVTLKDHDGNVIQEREYNNQGLFKGIRDALGQSISEIRYDILDRPWQLSDVSGATLTHAYDDLGRLSRQDVSGGGASTFGYSALGLESLDRQIHPGFTQNTQFDYDLAARQTTRTDALQQTTQTQFTPAGDLVRLTDPKQKNTHWTYDTQGRPVTKTDHLGQTVMILGYDVQGRVTTRWTPARGTTYYSYDPAGNLYYINYPNDPDVSFIYDPLNRISTMFDGTGSTTFSYTSSGELAGEDGQWSADNISYSYDMNGRRVGFSLSQPVNGPWTQAYQYDQRGRLTGLTTPAGTYSYHYASGQSSVDQLSELLASVTMPGGWIDYDYESRGLVSSIEFWKSPNTLIERLSYTYNQGGQRTRETRLNDYADYTYDAVGRIATLRGFENGGITQRRHEWLNYAYDAAGNLSTRLNDGLTQNFAVEDRNRLTSAGYSGLLTVAGMISGSASSVTVNSLPAALYADGSFASQPLAINTSYTAQAVNGNDNASDTISVNLPASVSLVHDANGNLTWDGKRNFFYDDENRLVRVEAAGLWRSEFAYDGLGRRRWRREYSWNGGGYWQSAGEVRYVYDGHLVIQERDANNGVLATYVRGLDKSMTLEGAGGIGGLLSRTDGYGTVYYYGDAGGNVRALINQDQHVVARYQYDPYGNMIGQSGGQAEGNLYRFSTKEYHTIHGLYYFGRRYYDANLQRWLTPDPLQESGGLNLYAYAANDPINAIDPWGLDPALIQDPASGFFGIVDSYDLYYLGWQDVVDGKTIDRGYAGSMPLRYQPLQGLGGASLEMTFGETASSFMEVAATLVPSVVLGPILIPFEVAESAADAGTQSVEGSSLIQALSYARAGVALVTPVLFLQNPGTPRTSGVKTIPDNAFVRIDATRFDKSISELGIQQRFFADQKVWMTQFKHIKGVIDPAAFETMLYRQNLWPSTQGRFADGVTIRLLNSVDDAVPAGITNMRNGIPQWRVTRDIPPSSLEIINQLR